MPNLLDIRKRIRSVKSTQQITRAMRMISASKLRRAQEAALASRPYGNKLGEMLRSIAARADVSANPLFRPAESTTVLVMVVTADKGLAGGFSSNLCKAVQARIEELKAAGKQPVILPVGRKGRDYFRRRGYTLQGERIGILNKLRYDDASSLATELMEAYRAGQTGEVWLAYNEFKSALAPLIVVRPFLPIAAEAVTGAGAAATADSSYIFEPDPQAILSELVPWHVKTQIWRVLLESSAAEHAARMTAMEAATKNAGEMIDQLTLNMNKVRQAAITKELIEVVSGAMALEG